VRKFESNHYMGNSSVAPQQKCAGYRSILAEGLNQSFFLCVCVFMFRVCVCVCVCACVCWWVEGTQSVSGARDTAPSSPNVNTIHLSLSLSRSLSRALSLSLSFSLSLPRASTHFLSLPHTLFSLSLSLSLLPPPLSLALSLPLAKAHRDISAEGAPTPTM